MNMNGKRRMLLGSVKTTGLPSAYQQVAYLDKYSTSTNKPYIDTGFIFTGKVCEFLWRGGGLDNTVGNPFGSQKSNTERFTMYAYYNPDSAYVRAGAADRSFGGIIQVTHNAGRTIGFVCNETDETNKYCSCWDYTNNEVWRDIYGIARENIAYTGTCKTGKSNYLFFANGGTNQNSFRYEYAAFREDGEMKREYIPCYRKSDRKPGMYDLVTKRFYTNVGTGEFEIGPEM